MGNHVQVGTIYINYFNSVNESLLFLSAKYKAISLFLSVLGALKYMRTTVSIEVACRFRVFASML